MIQTQSLSEVLVGRDQIARETVHLSFADVLGQGLEAAEDAKVVIFGVPSDTGTWTHVGTHLGPMGIRKAFVSFRPYSIELDFDFTHRLTVADIGNVGVDDWKSYDETFRRIDLVMKWLLERNKVPIMLGGDDSINIQAARTFVKHHTGNVGAIWFDDHYDSMEPFRGDPNYCGCPLRDLIVNSGGQVRPENVVLIGPRGHGNSYVVSRIVKELGYHVIPMTEVDELGSKAVIEKAVKLATSGTDSFYVNLDIDVLDYVYGPGCAGPRPGGMTSRELMTMVRGAAMGGAGAIGIVEVAPLADVSGATAMTAAECVLEMISGVASRMPEKAEKSAHRGTHLPALAPTAPAKA